MFHRATLTIPALLRDLVTPPVPKQPGHHNAGNPSHFLTFAVAVGIIILFTAPYVMWKCTGQKRAVTLVKKWEAEDARSRAPGAFVPVWSVKLYYSYSSTTVRS